MFCWKTFCKDSFPHFPVFDSTKKTSQWKTIFNQWKTLIKIRLIFYRLFSIKKFWKTISLSLITSPINIIFFCSRGKHNFLAPSLSHSKLSHFFFSSLCFFSNNIFFALNFKLDFFFSKKFSVWWILGKNYFFSFFF